MRKIIMALVAAGALAGCVSKKRYDDLVLEQQRVSEQKDSLVNDVLATTQMMADINSDLAAVKGLGRESGGQQRSALDRQGRGSGRHAWQGSRGDLALERGGGAGHAGKKRISAMSASTAPRKRR